MQNSTAFILGGLLALPLVVAYHLRPLPTSAETMTVSPGSASRPSSPAPVLTEPSNEQGVPLGAGDSGRDWTLLFAIEQVESGGNDRAIGDSGAAVGCLQIHPAMVADCNRILGRTAFTLNDRYNRDKSYEMFWTFTDYYNNATASRAQVARRWNGGPDGHLQDSTIPYWRKVEQYLEDSSQQGCASR